jgi:hypothetical protein
MSTSRDTPSPLAEMLAKALSEDFLLFLLVTSQTRGKFKSMNLPYGLGKSTLSLWISYVLHGGKMKDAMSPNEAWEEVKKDTIYYPTELLKRLKPVHDTRESVACPCIVWDAIQMTAPAESNVSKFVREISAYMTETRPEVKVIVGNAPNVNSIAAPLRKMVAYELIVFERGKYEVQKYHYNKNFRRPQEDLISLKFVEGTRDVVFGPLPNFMQKWYDDWRATKKELKWQVLFRAAEAWERRAKGELLVKTTEEGISAVATALALQQRKGNLNPKLSPED